MKINLYVGDRSKSIQVDVIYELPLRAVKEAIVNAVAHRDYTSNASVQVMLFPDRLEILNPGKLPVGLTIEELYAAHRSIPANPLIADTLYFYGTIEKMGTGTEDISNLCTQMGLKQPEFEQGSGFKVTLYRKTYTDQVTDQVTDQATDQVAGPPTHQPINPPTHQVTHQVNKLLNILDDEMDLTEIQEKLKLRDRVNVRTKYINPAIEQCFIELTHPDNRNHPEQKYRLTQKGKNYIEN